jgi:hypothetical protein
MRKLFLSIGAIAIAVTAVFVWSHTVLTPLQASPAPSVNPTDMMTTVRFQLSSGMPSRRFLCS